MWGSDQSASVEPQGLIIKLVRDMHSVNNSLGDGIKKIYDREKSLIDKRAKA